MMSTRKDHTIETLVLDVSGVAHAPMKVIGIATRRLTKAAVPTAGEWGQWGISDGGSFR
jgi:hypothetical protein